MSVCFGGVGWGECVRCVFVVSCYRKKRRRRIMVAAPITMAVGFCVGV